MALTTALGLFALSVLTAAFSRVLAEEIVDLISWTNTSLINTAVAWLPKSRRARLSEEWQSHVNEVPGRIAKLFLALGFLTAAYRIALADECDQRVKDWHRLIVQLDDCDFNLNLVMDAIEGDKFFASQGKLVSLVARVRALMTGAPTRRSQLAMRVAAVSDIPTTLRAKLLYGQKIKAIGREFDGLSYVIQQKNELIEQIRAQLRETKRILDARKR